MPTRAQLFETPEPGAGFAAASRCRGQSEGCTVRQSAVANVPAVRRHHRGFTLIELSVALVLLALIASVLYGSLSLAGESWNRGEAKAERTGEMRSAQDFLRRTLTAQHPLRFHKVPDQPLYFLGLRDSLSYAAPLPGRAGGGMYYFPTMPRQPCPISAAPTPRCSRSASAPSVLAISGGIPARRTPWRRPGASVGTIRSGCRI